MGLYSRIVGTSILWLLATVSPPVFSHQAPDSILFVYEEYPPFFIQQDEQVTGVFGGKALQVFEAAGLEVTWQRVSFKRLFSVLERSPRKVCTAGYGWKPERAKQMKFSVKFADGPASVAIAHSRAAEAVKSFSSMEDLMQDTTLKGVYLNIPGNHDFFAGHPGLKQKHVFVTAEDERLFDMVRTGRVDYAFLNSETASYLNSRVADGEGVTIVPLPGMSKGYARFILCSSSVSDAEMQRLNEGIKLVEDSAR